MAQPCGTGPSIGRPESISHAGHFLCVFPSLKWMEVRSSLTTSIKHFKSFYWEVPSMLEWISFHPHHLRPSQHLPMNFWFPVITQIAGTNYSSPDDHRIIGFKRISRVILHLCSGLDQKHPIFMAWELAWGSCKLPANQCIPSQHNFT